MLIVITIVFVVFRIGPLDPAHYILGDYATAETVSNLREQMELDKPIYVQYVRFLNRLIRGDLGRSFLSNEPVLSQLWSVLPYTIELVIAGILVGVIIGIPPGIIAALKPNSIFDHIIRILTLIGISIPVFVTGILLIAIFSVKLDLVPAIGADMSSMKNHFLQLILPALSCGILMMVSITRLVRASLLDVLSKDFIVTARSKGIRESIVVCKHALRNALLPLITFLGIYVNVLLGSAVIVEVIFTRPGVGRLIVEAIKSCDFPTAEMVIMFYAGTVVFVNLSIDIVYCIVDPRIAYE